MASVTLEPEALSPEVGDTARIVATLCDAAGNGLEGRALEWSSSAAGVLSVDGEGRVTALAVGTTVVTAMANGQAGAAPVTVRSNTAPVVLSVEPSLLLEGGTGSLSGLRFSSVPSENTLTPGGMPAEILSASQTLLTFRVLEGACLPQGPQRLVLTVGGKRPRPFTPSARWSFSIWSPEPSVFSEGRRPGASSSPKREKQARGSWGSSR